MSIKQVAQGVPVSVVEIVADRGQALRHIHGVGVGARGSTVCAHSEENAQGNEASRCMMAEVVVFHVLGLSLKFHRFFGTSY